MRSGTSFFDWTLFKKNFTRFWPVWVSYLVIWVFLLPVNMVMEGPANIYFQDTLCDASEANPIFALFFAVVCAMAVLSHLYSARSANFYGALPVRREGIFLTQYAAGLAFTLAPQLAVAGLVGIVSAANGVDAGGAVLTWLGTAAGSMFFFYSLAFLCGLFAGHILALPAFYGIANFLFVCVYELVQEVLSEAYYGFVGFGPGVRLAVRWLTPILRLSSVSWSYNILTYRVETSPLYDGWRTVAVYAAVGVVFVILSFFLYRSRRLESAGDVVAVRFMRPVFKYGAALCTGLALGYVTATILGEATLPYTAVVWTVVGCFLAQMVLDKSFRVFHKWRGAVAVGAVMAVLAACVEFDITGFETWLPEAEKVDSAVIETLYSSGASFFDDGDLQSVTVTDPEIIQKLITIHREAIEKRDIADRNASGVSSEGETGRIIFEITYVTGHARRSRWYNIPFNVSDVSRPGTAANALQSLYSDRDFLWEVYGFDKLEEYLASGGRITELDYEYREHLGAETDPEMSYDYLRKNGGMTFTSYDHVMAIYEAMKQDFAQGNLGVRNVSGGTDAGRSRILYFRFGDLEKFDPVEDDSTVSGSLNTIRICVGPSARHTLEVIARILPVELENQGLIE